MSYTIEELEEALGIIAQAIELYGEAYWPLFDRLETELQTRLQREQRLRQHLRPTRANSARRAMEQLDVSAHYTGLSSRPEKTIRGDAGSGALRNAGSFENAHRHSWRVSMTNTNAAES